MASTSDPPQRLESGDRAGRPPSPVELLHPAGVVHRAAILGAACPGWLRSSLPAAGDDRFDVVVVAPTDAEADDAEWLRKAESAARALGSDGLVYVLASPRRRRSLVRLLARAGLERAATLVHLPQIVGSRHFATADGRALRYALGSLLAPSPRRRAAAAVVAAPAGRLAFELLAGAGVVMRRPGARPLLVWLRSLVPEADPSTTILTRTWRETGGSSIVHVFERSGRAPVAVAKIRGAAGEPGGDDELRALETVASRARLAGVETPAPLGSAVVGGRPVLLAGAVSGRPAAELVAARPDLVPELLDRLAAWLEAWGSATSVPDGFGAADVEARLLEPARTLDAHVPDGAGYRAWLGELCAGLPASLPAVAAHNDLTTANVLVVARGRLAVVDWESARERDLPLRDLVYATVDAHFVSGRFASRAAAFDACYSGRGAEARAALRHFGRQRRALGLDPAAAVACFHACWLEHAANDVRRVPAADSEFAEILARLVRGREKLAERL